MVQEGEGLGQKRPPATPMDGVLERLELVERSVRHLTYQHLQNDPDQPERLAATLRILRQELTALDASPVNEWPQAGTGRSNVTVGEQTLSPEESVFLLIATLVQKFGVREPQGASLLGAAGRARVTLTLTEAEMMDAVTGEVRMFRDPLNGATLLQWRRPRPAGPAFERLTDDNGLPPV